jgi:hypothetical protein
MVHTVTCPRDVLEKGRWRECDLDLLLMLLLLYRQWGRRDGKSAKRRRRHGAECG